MTAPHADQLIDGYLARLRAAAAGLPRSTQLELVDDMRAHIAEARAREAEETDAAILNILDRLGNPVEVVADTRERLGIRPLQPYRPGALEIFAVILVPFFWPVGVILMWISPAWNWRDKLIGTLLPPGGFWFIPIAGALATSAHNGGSCVLSTDAAGHVISNTCPQSAGSSLLWAMVAIAVFVVTFVLPLITAGYLALRLRWGRRPEVAIA